MILEAGLYAPSGHNEQSWHFTVIQDRKNIEHINKESKEGLKTAPIDWMQKIGNNEKTDLTYGAPTLILVSGRKDAISYLIDCAAAIQNMLLMAESLNIGSVWLGLLRYYITTEDCRKRYKIPEGYEPVYGVALGYKMDEGQKPAPKRIENAVTFIKE